jgi:hypothetical protein
MLAQGGNVEPGGVLINEIMYHPFHVPPAAEDTRLEYIELSNTGAGPVDLAGWQISDGVDFVFPAVSLGAGEYLVVAADVNAFTVKYPDVTNVVGGWDGRLSNRGEVIELEDDMGVRIDRVYYADEGDWGVRELGPVDYRNRGWNWSNEHDGDGKSLELINPRLSNEYGQNWGASDVHDGTPGGVNSVAADDVAPLILDAVHFPVIPGHDEPVTVTARIVDESTAGITVALYYRVDTSVFFDMDIYPHHNPNDYDSVVMYDDGGHGDDEANDGIYGAEIPAHPDGTIIEFYLEASDAGGRSRTWPAPSIVDGAAEQVTNMLYVVDDSFEPYWRLGNQPIYYLIMTEAERSRLVNIGSDTSIRFSNAQMNGTFITIDGVDTEVRYLVGIRDRGKGSRTPPPNNYRVIIPRDQLWKGVSALNINSKYTYSQIMGSAIWRMAGLPAADANPVQVRVNGRNLALDDPDRMSGSYVALESLDNDWADHHFPDDGAGNFYRCADYDHGYSADLVYEGDDPDDYRNAYFKKTNESDDDWADLINLVYLLNDNNISDADFVEEVGKVIDVEQWMRYLAIDTLVGNREGGLNSGKGDDYAMYRGVSDPRFRLVPHDLDTILGINGDPDRSIFTYYERVRGLRRLLNHPETVRIYYSRLIDLIETVFAPEKFNPLIDYVLGDWVPESRIETMKRFAANRIRNVLEQVPNGPLTVGGEVPLSNGYHYRRNIDPMSLSGTANAITTRSVVVNGRLAEWVLKEGRWFIDGIAVNPGINRIIVQTFDGYNGAGNELERGYIDVWCDIGQINDYPKNNNDSQSSPAVSSDLGVRLLVRDSYLPGTPVLVRVELVGQDGSVERDIWDAVARLSVDNPGVALSDDIIFLRNGLGSALVTFRGQGDFVLTAEVDGMAENRLLVDLSDEPIMTVSGELAGDSTVWTGIVHVTDDLLVPRGHTLTIQPGTLVLLDGVGSGSGGKDIDVQGTIEALGTASAPVTFTAFDPTEAWGEIHHDGSEPSIYQYTNFTLGGHSPGGGHTGSGPVVRSEGSDVTFEYVSVTDNAGKIMQASGSDLTFRNCQLARSVMGPEIDNTALLMEGTWITEMHGSDDDDGIYVHSQSAGQDVTLRGGVIADTDDDGLDTLVSTVSIEDYIIRDCFDKGVSVYDGEVSLDYMLIINNGIGISAKTYEDSSARVSINHATIVCRDIGFQAFNRDNHVNSFIEYFVTNSIVLANDSVRTDFDPANIHIDYSNTGEEWLGMDNINEDTLFVDALYNDFHLREDSPCIDAGNDNGVVSNQGYYQDGQTSRMGGVLTESIVWTPEEGPYRIIGELTIPQGVELAIMPGTTVFFEPDAKMNVNGRLVAEGTEYEMIRFTRTPGTGGTWDGIQFENTMDDNRITYTVVEYGRTNDGMIGLEDSNILLDHVTLDNTDLRRIRTIDSSLIVSNSVFTDTFDSNGPPSTNNFSEHIWGRGIPADGYFIIENNIFGTTKGHNDAIDFDGPSRPDPVAQILNNVFRGGGDDALDLESDAHIEGNVFMHYHKDVHNTDPGESNVISAGGGKEYVIVRNVFHDMDHAMIIKDDSFATFVNNTVVDADKAAIYFDLAGQTRGPGRGVYVDGSIFRDAETIFDEVTALTEISVNRSIIPAEWHEFGMGNIDADPLFVEAGSDFHLKPYSPAIGTGPYGLDMGAYVPGGAAVYGEPDEVTYRTSAALAVGGPGITHYRYSLNGVQWSEERPVDEPIELTNLLNGQSYAVYVTGKDSAGNWQSEENPSASRTWTVDVSYHKLIINEVLATNISAIEHEGTFPDFIELYYDGPAPFDLAGMSIADNMESQSGFVFPAGTVINPGEYLVLMADSETTTSGVHLGFALSSDGEGVYLYDRNGEIVDSVEFCLQSPDLSIGRIGYDGRWGLNVPTFGRPNIAQPLGDTDTLKINEWFSSGHILFEDDFVEIFNPHISPVELSGLYLTDNPVTQRDKYKIGRLSFIGGNGFVVFNADGQNQPDHADFKLSSNGEVLGLFDAELNSIDRVIFGPQTRDASQGRAPDGADNFKFFELPTPGIANPLGNSTIVTELISIDDVWAYEQTDTALPSGWIEPDYDDSSWPRGEALLYVENSSLPAPKNTKLTLGPLTYYFRRHFTIDVEPSDIAMFELSTVIDDGAVFYINGAEVLRLRMPEGEIQHDTETDDSVTNAAFEGPFTISTEYLVRGDNIIAVEVHQSGPNSSDIVFGLQLDAVSINSDEILTRAFALLDGLRITELMYHAVNGSDYDFIELQNISQTTLDLTGVSFTEGIGFVFPQMFLDPGQRVVVVNNTAAFQSVYGTNVNIAGEYSGNLSNSGEKIVLNLPLPMEAAILRFEYSDNWYPTTDGGGSSLVINDPINPPVVWTYPESWGPATPSPGR